MLKPWRPRAKAAAAAAGRTLAKAAVAGGKGLVKGAKATGKFSANLWDWTWWNFHGSEKKVIQNKIRAHKSEYRTDRKGAWRNLEANKKYRKVSARADRWRSRVDKKDTQLGILKEKKAALASKSGVMPALSRAYLATRIGAKSVRRWDLNREARKWEEKKASFEAAAKESIYQEYERVKKDLSEVEQKLKQMQENRFKYAKAGNIKALQAIINRIKITLARMDRKRLVEEVKNLEAAVRRYEDVLDDLLVRAYRQRVREKIHAGRMKARGSSPKQWDDSFDHGFERLRDRMDTAIKRGGSRARDVTIRGFKRLRSAVSTKKEE